MPSLYVCHERKKCKEILQPINGIMFCSYKSDIKLLQWAYCLIVMQRTCTTFKTNWGGGAYKISNVHSLSLWSKLIFFQKYKCAVFVLSVYRFSFADIWSSHMCNISPNAMLKKVFLFALPWIAYNYGMSLCIKYILKDAVFYSNP